MQLFWFEFSSIIGREITQAFPRHVTRFRTFCNDGCAMSSDLIESTERSTEILDKGPSETLRSNGGGGGSGFSISCAIPNDVPR